MIQIKNITKSFQANFWEKKFIALDDVSFSIHSGKMTGFLGANGAGKTTMMKVIMSFISPDSGEVIFSKELGNDNNKIFSKIAYLPERPYFYPYLTGREFLEFMGKLNDVSHERLEKEILYWSERLKIDFALSRKVRDYSKGMLQRLGLASVLLHDPLFILLDEPLSGLDPVGRKEFKDIFLELHQKSKALFFSSHIVPDIEEICDELIVLDKGKLFYQGRMDEILKSNSESHLELLYLDQNGQKIQEFLGEDQRDLRLKKIFEDGHSVISLKAKNRTLEDIIYNRSSTN